MILFLLLLFPNIIFCGASDEAKVDIRKHLYFTIGSFSLDSLATAQSNNIQENDWIRCITQKKRSAEESFQCLCSNRFQTLKEFKSHVATKHLYRCIMCTKNFSYMRREDLSRHLSFWHHELFLTVQDKLHDKM